MGVSITSFNPHTHEGCDQDEGSRALDVTSFNPHTHEGCDGYGAATPCVGSGFNPHTHEGCDKGIKEASAPVAVSIHTPTKGVTDIERVLVVAPKFQSTHPRRV